jgi:lipoic acid synthetase
MSFTAGDAETRNKQKAAKRLPPWFRMRISGNERAAGVRNLVRDLHLNTVCRSAACPNRSECWNSGTAAFMILGNVCTRNCTFCSVPKGMPAEPDPDEPNRVADAVATLGLDYVVVTSVTRDDLLDGGASLFAATIRAVRSKTPGCCVEVLIPDFQGSEAALQVVLDAEPDVLNHNIETVPSLYKQVRPQAAYQRSISLLTYAGKAGCKTKSGIMLGLGERVEEVLEVMRDLREAGCTMLTLGQYLQPGKNHLKVHKFYHPDDFDMLREQALALGFFHVVSGPLVRSSYHAANYGAGNSGRVPKLEAL